MMNLLTKRPFFNTAFLVLFVLLPVFAYTQTISSAGKDFWVGYGAHAAMFNADGSVNNASGGAQEMQLYISATNTANVKVEIPLLAWSKTFTLNAGELNQIAIPKTGASDARLVAEGVSSKGIHISADNPVSAYCHIYSAGSSASSLLLPEEMLGQDYEVAGITQAAVEKNSFSYCFIVAEEDATTVQVTPSANTLTHQAGAAFTQTLNKGQVLNLVGAATGNANNIYTGADLTGTRITVLNAGTGPCKRVAVFAGSSNTMVSCSNTGNGNNIIQQVFPLKAYNNYFLAVPTAGMPANKYRVFITSPTSVSVNGKVLNNPVSGKYYEFETTEPCIIGSSKPVIVAQLITSAGQCGNALNGGNGGPDMIFLSPLAFGVSTAIINCPPSSNITSQYINVALPTVAIDSFAIDKATQRQFFKAFPANADYSYAQIPLAPGIHTLHIDTLSFVATVYGYGPQESYAYNAGMYIKTLSALTVKNPYYGYNQASPCKATPFNMVYTLKRRATELIFDFANNEYLSPNNVVDLKNPVPDSIYSIGRDSFFRYVLPATYTFSNAGGSSFYFTITEYLVSDEGCIEKWQFINVLNVLDRPQAIISAGYNSCGDSTVSFNDASIFNGGYFSGWQWKFGDGTTSNEENPVKAYVKYGDYSTALRAITNNGCYADTTKAISLNPLPQAAFKDTGLFCPQNNIQFTDATTIAAGWQITKRNWDFGDGASSTQTNPVKQYATGGNYRVKLTVTSNKSCIDSAIKNITIYSIAPLKSFITVANPYARPDTPQICSATPFNISVTFTARQQEIAWDFGGNPSLSPNANVDVTAPAADSIYFNGQDSFFRYQLPAVYTYTGTGNLPVKVTAFTPTKGGCTIQTVFNNNIQVLDKPVAQWQLNYNKCANDTLHFINTSTAPGETINTYRWDFGDAATADTANPVKKYAAYGKYTARLSIVTSAGCFDDTASVISLSPAPVAAFNYFAPLYCTGSAIGFTDASTMEAPFKIAQWQWSFGDGATDPTPNAIHPYSNAGTYTVQLIAYSDNSCTDTAVKPITIYSYPLITMPAEAFISAGTSLQLPVTYAGNGLSFLWSPATALSSDTAAFPVTTTLNDITYYVTVTGEGGCAATSNIAVHVEKGLAVPNVFSPNADGVNDTWRIGNIEGYPNCTVKVFNRSGQLVFSSVGYTRPWDGTYNGKPLPIGTYYYIININSQLFPNKSGSITILR